MASSVAFPSAATTEFDFGARADLLRVLIASPDVRADLIRHMHERGLDLAEVLMDLEADDALRRRTINALRLSSRPNSVGSRGHAEDDHGPHRS